MTIKTPGYHSDGGGLYLQVSPTLSKSWIFKFVRNKKATEIGLGSFGDISLEAAREQASEYRKLLKQGLNPLVEKRKIERELHLSVAKSMTFAECASAYIESKYPPAKPGALWCEPLKAVNTVANAAL